MTSKILIRIILISTFSNFAIGLISQDTIWTKYHETDNIKKKINLLNQEITKNIYDDYEYADSCANLILSFANETKSDSLYCHAMLAKAKVQLVKANYDSVFYFSTKCDERSKGYNWQEKYSASFNQLHAIAYYYRGEYGKSLKENFKQLDFIQRTNADFEYNTLTNIAINYERLEDFDSAIDYYEEALSITPEDNQYTQAVIINNISAVRIRRQEFDEAIIALLKANKIAYAINHSLLKVDTDIGLAKCYFGKKELNVAQAFTEKAVFLSDSIKSFPKYISSINLLGEINLLQGKINESISAFKKALILSNRKKINEVKIQIFKNLSSAYFENGDYQKALIYKDSIIIRKDSIFTKEKASITEELNVKYESAKKESEIVKQSITINKRTNQRNLIFGGGLFALLLAAFYWNRKHTSDKIHSQQKKIQSQKISQLEKEKKLLTMSSMIEGQEAERKRIAQDLHDGLGGLLASVKTKFGIIQHQIKAIESLDVYNEANTMLDNACTEVRKIAHNMMPDALTKLGLIEAVKDVATQFGEMKVDVIDLGMHQLDETQKVMLYRVIQEFLNNTRKHALASEVIIQFSTEGDDQLIYLEDNGGGFDKFALDKKKGMGLKSMESRINYIGGTLNIDSAIGVGTTMTIKIPKESSHT